MSEALVRQEIIDWHRFLHAYLKAEIDVSEGERMWRVLTPEFRYVTVWGEAHGADAFLAAVPGMHGSVRDIDVDVEDIEALEIGPDLFMATFVQVETFEELPPRRCTSAILRVEGGIAKLVHFHLTLIDPARRPPVGITHPAAER